MNVENEEAILKSKLNKQKHHDELDHCFSEKIHHLKIIRISRLRAGK